MRDLRQLVVVPDPTTEDKIVDAFATGVRAVRLTSADGSRTVTLEKRAGLIVVHDDSGALERSRAKRERKARARAMAGR